jgi:small-conductance mechanosensitive channel
MTNLDRFADIQLLGFGAISVTLGGLVAGAVIFLIAAVAARLVSRGLRRVRERAPQRTTGALYLLEKLVTYGLVIVGVVAGLSAAGLNLSSLALFAGAIGIGHRSGPAGGGQGVRLGPVPDLRPHGLGRGT